MMIQATKQGQPLTPDHLIALQMTLAHAEQHLAYLQKDETKQAEFKQMILDSTISDIVYTPAVSGVHANFMRGSLERVGLDLDALDEPARGLAMQDEAKAWRDTWSAGQGVHVIHQVSRVQEIVDELAGDFEGG